MKYPFIGGIDDDCKVLLIENGYGIAIEHQTIEITGVPERGWNNRSFKNITGEYLANTYGKVESKEHAEFIVELAKNAGLSVFTTASSVNHFIIKDGLSFHNCEKIKSTELKQITIPLPPKQIQTATSEEEFEMQQIMKNNGDNLVLGCEDSKCEEWPCVGDEVCYKNSGNSKGVVLAIDGSVAWVKDNSGGYSILKIENLVKPKTPEEELRDEIELIIKESIDEDYSPSANAEHITGEILSKYNITKKPQ